MAVISITITESTEQLVAGVPKSVTITTNIPATIFYTLDGTEPTLDSNVYVSAISISTALPNVRLRVFATNGMDSSAIVERNFGPSTVGARIPHSSVSGQPSTVAGLGLFASNSVTASQTTYASNADAGTTVLAPDLATYESGMYDADGNPAALTNAPLEEYRLIESESDWLGNRGRGIGTLVPVTVQQPEEVPTESDRADKLFNPRALVMFQDLSTENPDDPPQLNRSLFTMEKAEGRDGIFYYNSAPSTATATGSFVRSFYNPRENTVTYYYYDNHVGRWLISKQPYQVSNPNITNLASGMVFGRDTGSNGFVFKWRPFARRVLG